MSETVVSERNKAVVRRLIDDVMNGGDLSVLDDIYDPALAKSARDWIEPFRRSFPDMRMEIVELVGEGDTIVGRFRCSGTHTEDWRGHPPTGKRFTRIDEVGFFHFQDGKVVRAWSIEDTLRRLDQLGLR